MERQAIMGLLVLVLALSGCQDDQVKSPENDQYNPVLDPNLITPDWTETTHGKTADPDYTIVFPQHHVNTIEIGMTDYDWSFIQGNMERLGFGKFGEPPEVPPPFGTDPEYVMASVRFNGRNWYKAGFRLKGNSSLHVTWRNGIYKLPFRLDFNKFEDVYPQIEDQHFYGFNELSFSPGANDYSMLREKVCADIFRDGGIPASRTAFYKVYIDFGEGIKYCGVYAAVEVVEDTMVKTQFGNDDGNIYKPESRLLTFSEREFEKKNNKAEADYTDVKLFIETLNSPLRTSDVAQWRTNLEQSFDVDHFIRWLAINNTMQNWDTYGRLPHNYYLYNHPLNKLTWIPWDNNESLSDIHHGSGKFSMPEVQAQQWPLIRFIIDDPVYHEKYRQYIKEFSEEVFITGLLYERFDYYHNLIKPYVVGPEAEEIAPYTQLPASGAFDTGLDHLKQHILNRQEAIATYLN